MTEPTTPDEPRPPLDVGQIILEEVHKHIAARVERFTQNDARITSLLNDHIKLLSMGGNSGDILRAAVVLLHANLEDFLRGVAESYLPLADEGALNKIPLAGSLPGSRGEKFPLGKLASHRGKTVDQLLVESVNQHLQRRTFNNAGDVAALLDDVGGDFTAARTQLPLSTR